MKYCILGRRGFIGKALSKKLIELGHEITSNPTTSVNVVVNLASPSHPEFEKNVPYHMGESIRSAELLLPFCKEHDIFYVYASSALVYEIEKISPFRNCKLALEQMAEAYGGRTLGLRIFPVYGVGENKTAISQWCNDMKKGWHPVIYGDGEQMRDFIYVDDVVDSIIKLVEYGVTGVADVGAGKPISFNSIVKAINQELKTDIKPVYIKSPEGYSEGIVCENPLQTKISINEGIRKILLEQ